MRVLLTSGSFVFICSFSECSVDGCGAGVVWNTGNSVVASLGLGMPWPRRIITEKTTKKASPSTPQLRPEEFLSDTREAPSLGARMGLTSRSPETVSLGTVAAPPAPPLASQFTPSYPARCQLLYSDTVGAALPFCVSWEKIHLAPISLPVGKEFLLETSGVSSVPHCPSSWPLLSHLNVPGLAQLLLLLYCTIAVSSLVWLSLVQTVTFLGAGAVSAPSLLYAQCSVQCLTESWPPMLRCC